MEDVVNVTEGLHPELEEALGVSASEFAQVVGGLVHATMVVTLTVYLKTDCYMCLREWLVNEAFKWTNKIGYRWLTEEDDYSQYKRQLVIHTKELLEETITAGCTCDMENLTIH